jgi:L-2-hydroxyglutarate oxidase LhgO
VITESEVFDAVRRGYTEFESTSNAEIIDYFSEIDQGSVAGHVSHIKGILFEQEYVDSLAAEGVEAQTFEATNHPITDISILGDGDVVTELQLKATDSVSYVTAAIQENPEVGFVVTSEIAGGLGTDLVMDSGIENTALDQAVQDTLMEEALNPVSPLSVIGWAFGLPF